VYKIKLDKTILEFNVPTLVTYVILRGKMAAAEVREKIDKKDEIEKEILALHEVLESHHTNMTDELVDEEGFPRSDVDVLTVRKTRVRIIYLQNDLKNILKEIEEGLYNVHARARENRPPVKKADNSTISADLEPFLHVDLITEGSPAEKAGLEVNDMITRFGSITLDNFSGLKVIGELVNNSKGTEINVTVQRKLDNKLVNKSLKLTPNVWSGRGFLGCNIVPIKK